MQGTIIITKGADDRRIGVGWECEEGSSMPSEERQLFIEGVAALPADFMTLFREANDPGALEAAGAVLWECIKSVGAVEDHRENGVMDRIVMDLTEAPAAWRGLPWEAAFDGNVVIGQQVEVPFIRRIRPQAGRKTALATGWPYRMLIVTGEAETHPGISVGEEIESLEDGLWLRRREIITRTLIQPTQQELCLTLQEYQPHVLHFIGHGTGRSLVITDRGPAGTQWDWTATLMKNWLSNGRSPMPHFVFLNACHTNTATAAEEKASLTKTFMDIGVPATIGLSDAVAGEAASTLTRRFYRSWIEGESMDRAITRARLEISIHPALQNLPQQAHLPCLTCNSSVAEGMHWKTLHEDVEHLLNDMELSDLHKTFVDRNAERARIFGHWIKHGEFQPQAASVMLIHGKNQTGKSHALRMVMKAMACQGWIARCHPPAGNWNQLLSRIVDGGAQTVLEDRLPGNHFEKYRQFAAELKLDALSDQQDAFSRWREGLQSLLNDQVPVVLAIDQLNLQQEAPEWLKLFSIHVLKPVLDGQIKGPLLIVLVMNDTEEQVHGKALEKDLNQTLNRVTLDFFGQDDESRRAVKQYFRQRWSDFEREAPLKADKPTAREVRNLVLKEFLQSKSAILGTNLRSQFDRMVELLKGL